MKVERIKEEKKFKGSSGEAKKNKPSMKRGKRLPDWRNLEERTMRHFSALSYNVPFSPILTIRDPPPCK
jgi:hypothetical protein